MVVGELQFLRPAQTNARRVLSVSAFIQPRFVRPLHVAARDSSKVPS